ncbi:MAG: PBP1A family penicillin-binding protein [Pseudomonadota bacterium]
MHTVTIAIMWLSLCGLCAAVLSLAGIYLYLDPQIPTSESYRNVRLETPLRVMSKDQKLLAEYGERRVIPITLDEVPQDFINALLDTEDKRFYTHQGIDFISLANDMINLVGTMITQGELGPGASTITMQLARNVSFSLERRFLRKFKEMLLALKIEQELTKDEILELYMNVVSFGKRAYGAQAAAFTYYGKPLADLNLPQLAMLAGIPQAPSAANPINGPERAINRRNLVLSRMLAQGSINIDQYNEAVSAPITAQVFARELDVPSPYAAEWVRQQGLALLDDLYTGGYEIVTTIDADMQREAINALRSGLQNYDRQHGYRGPEANISESYEETFSVLQNPGLTWLAEQLAVGEEDTQSGSTAPEGQSADEVSISLSEPASATAISTTLLQQDEVIAARQTVSDLLAQTPTYADLSPAIVLAVTPTHALIQTQDPDWSILDVDDAKWAREYINEDRRGPVPEAFTQILNVGDLIRIRAKTGSTQPHISWQLSQLPEIQGALVALDPENGAVRAMVGGLDFFRNQYNHALQAARQPGSGFKPFVYSAAVANNVTPASLFMDAPLVFDDANLESQYRPDNDNNQYNGPTRLRQALYRSINLVSIRVLLEITAGRVLEHVPNFGFSTNTFPRNTQLAIGGGTMAVTPMEMARAYAVFANGGYLIDPHIVASIRTNNGETIYEAAPAAVPPLQPDLPTRNIDEAEPTSLEDLFAAAAPEEPELIPNYAPRVIDERNAFIMNSMLQDVIKRGTGRRARGLRRDDLAGKTGTTNDAADTWFNGYSPNLAASVWVGFSNLAPLGSNAYGSNTALPIWIDFMEEALEGIDEKFLPQPEGLVTIKIDPKTGFPADPNQKNAIFELFMRENAPNIEDKATVEPTEEVKAVDLF